MIGPTTGTGRPRRPPPDKSPGSRPDRPNISATNDFFDCTGDVSSDGNKVRPWSIQPASSLGPSSPRRSKGIGQRIPSGSAANTRPHKQTECKHAVHSSLPTQNIPCKLGNVHVSELAREFDDSRASSLLHLHGRQASILMCHRTRVCRTSARLARAFKPPGRESA